MSSDRSIEFFDRQFERQVRAGDLLLNPFEQAALPYLHGRVLDFGCGLGNLAIAAARRGCQVVALDASAAAIDHIKAVATDEKLDIAAQQVDLRRYEIGQDYDTIVSIGLLMFFDCPTARRVLQSIRQHVADGGCAAINLLVEGTTFMEMFDPDSHCLFARGELADRFADWDVLESSHQDFDARAAGSRPSPP